MTNTDFVSIKRESTKKGCNIVPDFNVETKVHDIMIRGRGFYAVWDEDNSIWSTDECRVAELVDNLINKELAKASAEGVNATPKYLKHYSTGKWREWKSYSTSLPDSYHKLNNKIIFANDKITKRDYATKKLNYSLAEMATPAYDKIMSTLYSPEEREKLEWAIGSIISGDSKKLQKFIVLYGEGGTGKGTFLKILARLFDIYTTSFNAASLVSKSNNFPLEDFQMEPLVAIDSDCDLSRIEDNTVLNKIVSHESVSMNIKFKSPYQTVLDCLIFCGSNSPVKITNVKSGLIRRLIDVYPSGNRIDGRSYNKLMEQVEFELGGIAYKCYQVYKQLGFHYYDKYVPKGMIVETNMFYNFVEDSTLAFMDEKYVTLKKAWAMYKEFCNEANASYMLNRMAFQTELKSYFDNFYVDYYTDDRKHLTNVYTGFRASKFDSKVISIPKSETKLTEAPTASEGHSSDTIDAVIKTNWIELETQPSKFDILCANDPAQYSGGHGGPLRKWSNAETRLKDIRTNRIHYVKVPINHIVIDFDIANENGEKDLSLNLEAASSFPSTYAEVSKSGKGLHLHYIYDGDPEELACVYKPGIEIKVFSGNSSLRRKLTLCNNLDISHISGGLPFREESKKMISSVVLKNERSIRTLIKKHLNKTIVPSTRQSIDLINSILDEAYEQGMPYDVSDLQPVLWHFASTSTHQSQYCINVVAKMKLKSKDIRDDTEEHPIEKPIVFFDVEIFPNVFILCFKIKGETEVYRLINPTGSMIEGFIDSYRLIGFNNRKYDNHILYGRMLGYSNKALFELSQKLIANSLDAGFLEAYNISYADIYDFCSKKQSLKKWEIELKIHHMENAYPWDKDLPEDKWEEVANYCCNDVIATEAVFDKRYDDFVAREILAEWSGLTINSTTRMHATKIIFGNEKHPKLKYVDLSEMFPGYTYEAGVSRYRGEITGEGGYVFAIPGIYYNVALLDIASMHPHSILAMEMFGEYTIRFKNLVDCRIHIKKHEYEEAKQMLPESVHKYLTDDNAAALSFALKIIINSIYGYTKAGFDNPFKDPRNKDNIVAKRGALFMINLKHEVQKRGFIVAHIKTDSIKIPDATPEIIQFVTDYGESYGYFFEHEATYKRMCLINDAVYIAKYEDGSWTATGAQFQVPYVFKTLFSKEPIEFDDMCETKSVTSSLYLDMDESLPEGEHNYVFVGRIGLFCPVKDGAGGGRLLRSKELSTGEVRYDAVTGTKGYRWVESETIKNLDYMSIINLSYYDSLVIAAKEAINEFGDVEQFIFD